MKGKLLLTILMLTPLCCIVETEPVNNATPSCDHCADWGECTYTEGCGCVPTMATHCEAATDCFNCCIGTSPLDGCAQCRTCP